MRKRYDFSKMKGRRSPSQAPHELGIVKRSAMRKKLLPPIHPGEILREEFMKPLNLSANAFAQHLGMTTARVNEIANQRRGITADTALRLAR